MGNGEMAHTEAAAVRPQPENSNYYVLNIGEAAGGDKAYPPLE